MCEELLEDGVWAYQMMTRTLPPWIQATYKQREQTGKARGFCWQMHSTWISISLCTNKESIHRTVTLQFLSSAPWWLKFLPFVTVHDIKCHPDEAWSSNWQCRQGFERSCSVPWSYLLRTTFPGPPLLNLHLCCSQCASSPFPSFIFWWLLVPYQRQMIFSHCLSTESDRKQHLRFGSLASSLTSSKFIFLLEELQRLSAPAPHLR